MHGEMIKMMLFIACSLLHNIASMTFVVITASTNIYKDTSTPVYEFTPILRSKRHFCLYLQNLCSLRKVNILSVV